MIEHYGDSAIICTTHEDVEEVRKSREFIPTFLFADVQQHPKMIGAVGNRYVYFILSLKNLSEFTEEERLCILQCEGITT